MSDLLQALDLAGRLVVAGALGWAAVAKVADLGGLRATLYLSRLTRPWVPQLTVTLPAFELTLGAGLLVERLAWPATVAAVVLLAAFTAFLALDAHAGEGCNCFGRRTSSSRRGGIVRDLLLIAVAVPALVRGPGAHRWGVPPAADVPFLLVGALGIAVLIAFGFRRDGARRPSATGRRRLGTPPAPVSEDRVEAPPFDVPALDGGRLRRTPGAVVLFTESGCGQCAAVLPLAAGRADVVVLVAGGTVEAAALADRYRLEPGRVGVDETGAVADRYLIPATPAAHCIASNGLLVDAHGRPTSKPAVGADAVRLLLLTTPRDHAEAG